MIRVSAVQIDVVDGEVERNRARALGLAERALQESPDLVVFPEGFTVGYPSVDLKQYAEPLDGPTTTAFIELSRRSGARFIFGLYEQAPEGLYNSAVFVGPGGIEDVYHKTHLYIAEESPKICEWNLFLPGERLGLFDTPFGRLGVLICYDGCHPELPRALVLEGAELLIWINDRAQLPPFEVMSASFANKVPVVGVNRVGVAGWAGDGPAGVQQFGGTVILDGRGRMLAHADGPRDLVPHELWFSTPEEAASAGFPVGGEDVITADLDLAAMNVERCSAFTDRGIAHPFFYTRRPDLYGALMKPPLSWTGAKSQEGKTEKGKEGKR